MKPLSIALVGATGLVGTKMLELLEERQFPVSQLIPVASARSVGKDVNFQGNSHTVVGIEEAISMKADVAIFSAGGSTSLSYAEKFAAAGTTVIDNSSAWRMDKDKKLIVPEINAHLLTKADKIIANPNCSTIQMVLALSGLHKAYQIEHINICTYQSISGTGVKAVQQLEAEEKGQMGEKAYPHQIYRNCLPHCDEFLENGYSKEEMKLHNETRKILGDDSILVNATAVRVPVIGGHSESVTVRFQQSFEIPEVLSILNSTEGVVVQDQLQENLYPMPLQAHEKDEVFVGRIRKDFSQENSLNMWIVSDNLRKGAATNAIQIAEYLNSNHLI